MLPGPRARQSERLCSVSSGPRRVPAPTRSEQWQCLTKFQNKSSIDARCSRVRVLTRVFCVGAASRHKLESDRGAVTNEMGRKQNSVYSLVLLRFSHLSLLIRRNGLIFCHFHVTVKFAINKFLAYTFANVCSYFPNTLTSKQV